MNILSAIVVPPHLTVSGGARAGEQLSAALTQHCDVTVASMMNAVGAQGVAEGRRPVSRLEVRCSRPPVLPWSKLPNRYVTPFYRSNLPELIRSGGFDLIHLHNPMPGLELARVARACAEIRVPYVISTHGFNEIHYGSKIYGFGPARRLFWERLVRRPVAAAVCGAAGIFALSPADFEIVREMGFSRGELTVVSNGVYLPKFAPAGAADPTLARFGIPAEPQPGQITCMFLANHTPNKGLPVLLEAFRRLARPYLLIIGGEQRTGVDYRSHTRSCGDRQRIVVTGRLSDAEVAVLFRRSDVFVFPSLADTFPLVVLEAMAHGLVVVGTRVGGIPYQLSDRCGLLVDPGSAADLAAAVDMIARNPGCIASMGRAARARVAANFTWEHAAVEAYRAYGRILDRRHGHTRADSSGNTHAA